MSQTCASCLTFSMDKITKSQPELKPRWLDEHDYVEEFVANTNNFKIRNPTKSNSKAFLEMKSCANKKILFWASESKEHHDILVKDAKAAYGDFSNLALVPLAPVVALQWGLLLLFVFAFFAASLHLLLQTP